MEDIKRSHWRAYKDGKLAQRRFSPPVAILEMRMKIRYNKMRYTIRYNIHLSERLKWKIMTTPNASKDAGSLSVLYFAGGKGKLYAHSGKV